MSDSEYSNDSKFLKQTDDRVLSVEEGSINVTPSNSPVTEDIKLGDGVWLISGHISASNTSLASSAIVNAGTDNNIVAKVDQGLSLNFNGDGTGLSFTEYKGLTAGSISNGNGRGVRITVDISNSASTGGTFNWKAIKIS